MEYSEIKELMDSVTDYINRSTQYLKTEDYTKLVALEQEYADLPVMLQDVPVDKLQMFSSEMKRFNTQLTDVRDAMINERDSIRSQLDSMGNNSSAAKAYLKSSMNAPKTDD